MGLHIRIPVRIKPVGLVSKFCTVTDTRCTVTNGLFYTHNIIDSVNALVLIDGKSLVAENFKYKWNPGTFIPNPEHKDVDIVNVPHYAPLLPPYIDQDPQNNLKIENDKSYGDEPLRLVY